MEDFRAKLEAQETLATGDRLLFMRPGRPSKVYES